MRIKVPAVRIAQADSDVVQQDMLTCGVCQKPFALADIVKFIQHKVLACNKENYHTDSDDGGNGGGPGTGGVPLGVVNTRRPSISAPITVKKAASSCSGRRSPSPSSPPPPSSTPKRHDDTDADDMDDVKPPRIKLEDDDHLGVKRLRTDVVDAESNTTHSEPSNYVCSTCKQRLHSAWRLVQHVQNTHGIKIYVESSPSASSSSSSTPPNTKIGNVNNHSSTSSTSSNCSSSSGNGLGGAGTPLSLPPPGVSSRLPHLHHHTDLPSTGGPGSAPATPNNTNPFGVGGLLRMPLGDRPPQFPASPVFARPSSHHDHHFRMEHLVSEQFRHHPLGLAAAVAAVAGVPPPHHPVPPFPPVTVSSGSVTSTPRGASVPPPLSIEPQLDFYSQRLRQLAGTTSPGAANGTPSPRKQMMTPPFSSPSHHPPSTAGTPILLNNNNNNNNNNTHSSSPNSPEKQSPMSDPVSNSVPISITPRSSSTPPISHKQTDLDTSDRDQTRACEFCGKKFRFQSNLIVHRRTHTGEKPYKCAVCNHACTQSSKLKRHMKIHRIGKVPENGGSANSTPDNISRTGSVDDDGDDEEDDDDDDEEEEEEEEMELEEEEGDDDDDDEDLGGDAPEDLTTKSTSSTPPNNGSGDGNKVSNTPRPTPTPTPLEKIATSGSLVGELMDKFGLSNIQQYNEAYKQALQESVVGSHHLHIKDEFQHRSPLIPDNNNGGKVTPPVLGKSNLENGLIEKSAVAMRFREEFAKNIIASGQPPLDLIGAPHGLFGTGNAFENPFDAANKRLKLDLENHHRNEREGLYAGLWLPAMAHHREHMFSSEMELLGNRSNKPSDLKGGSGAKPGPSLAAALNLGQQQLLKKENKRNDTCEFCGKVFKNCSNLTVHRRSHTGEKPYKCELCSYACAQSSKLTRHMKTHGRLGKDVYRCRFCEMPFSVPSTLEKHMRKCVVNQNIKAGAGGHMHIKDDLQHLMADSNTGDSSASASKDAT